MAPAVDHELGAKDAAEGPATKEGGYECGGELRESGLRPPAALQHETHHEGERDAAKTSEAALPHRDPAPRMAGVVAPIGRDVREARPHQSADEQPDRKAGERFNVDLRATKASPRVDESHVGRDRKTKTVSVKDQGTEVKRSGKTRHA